MATYICSFSLAPESQEILQLQQPVGYHYQLCSLPVSHSRHSDVNRTIGVVFNGQCVQHIVLILAANDYITELFNPQYSPINDMITSCCNNTNFPNYSFFTLKISDSIDDMTQVLGTLTNQTHTIMYVGMKRELDYGKHKVDYDLLNRIAEINTKGLTKRKRSIVEPVYITGIGTIPSRVAHDAACNWMTCHAGDSIQIDYNIVKNDDGSVKSKVRSYKVKNDKDDYVMVRTLKECIEYVQKKTDRNFWNDMKYDGKLYTKWRSKREGDEHEDDPQEDDNQQDDDCNVADEQVAKLQKTQE